MKKSNQIILSALGAIFIFSIAFQLRVNRHLHSSKYKKETVTYSTEKRTVANFNKISLSHGIEVYFTQDSISQIKIEAQEKVIQEVITKTKNETLIIEMAKQKRENHIVKVYIYNDALISLKVDSGAYFETQGKVTGDNLDLEFSSDTRANLDLSFQSVQCKAASGSQIKFKGNTSNIEFTN
ncbi:DUF2807 domain-containing protein [Pontimicrobium sp. SW4]|uniref:DUF2807 domain-containing protein n=1 Tax=Pontimicrobium sp. SW4 TaxID=3153519 RepID=A0AAU7BW02_9FLAO